VFDNKTTFKLATQDDLCVPITVLSALTASPFHFPFLLYLSLHSLGQHLPTPRHYHAAAMGSLFHLFLAFPLCTYTYPIQSPGTPEVAVTIQTSTSRRGSPHVYKTVLLLVEEDNQIHPAVLCNQVVSSPSFLSISTHLHALPVSAIVQWNCCPHDRCRFLALVLSQPAHTHTLSLFSFLSLLFLDDTSTLAAPILDTVQRGNLSLTCKGYLG
jgi:hypothetical protein